MYDTRIWGKYLELHEYQHGKNVMQVNEIFGQIAINQEKRLNKM